MAIANADQHDQWNREAASWVNNHERINAMLGAFDADLFAAADIRPGDRVLDVGCGTGSTTLSAAREAAPGGVAVGVDLSETMVAEARRRAATTGLDAKFEIGDAQVQPFADAPFDVVISRFGVMFFADPTAAFANLHEATRPGGRLATVTWQPMMAQEWMLVIGAAVMKYAKEMPSMPSEGPGMFGLADPDRIKRILGAAGWRSVEARSSRVPLLLGGGGELREVVAFFGETMLEMVLGEADPQTRREALASLRDALAPYEGPDGVRLRGAVWITTAIA